MTARLKQIAPPVLLGCLTLIFYWKILLTNLILVGGDVFLYFYPYKAYAAEALRSGRLPLWNPHLFMGVPFLANSQAGLLYPLNWLFLWADPPQQVAYSIGLHIWLAGVGAYLLARHSLSLSPTAALVGGIVFAFSGFLGAQAEHLNQLQVSAWLPWLFLLFDQSCYAISNPSTIAWRGPNGRLAHLRRSYSHIAWLALIISLMLLAGHTQSVYISLFGLGLYNFLRAGLPWGTPRTLTAALIQRLPDLIPLLLALSLAVMIAAAQLLPTLELTSQSIRSQGLTYRETIAFSLNPLKLPLTIFPPYGVNLEAKLGVAFSEFVAYIGLIPLFLAGLGLIYLWRNKRAKGWGIILAGTAGLGLAFGGYTWPIFRVFYFLIPGFKLFRVPARWLLLYTLAAALLAALGFERIRQPRWRWLLVGLIVVELFIAAQSLPYTQPTAPEAYSFLRPAIVQLLATERPTDRFLSLSGIEYDPGDLAEINQIFGDQLPPPAIYDYVVATKEKEVLFFNLPLIYGLNAIDGYDGGLLPLRRFVEWQRLFLAEDRLSLDGRLRENLEVVPPGRLLSLIGVRHIITDKVHDVWLNDIFYDLQFPAFLDPATTTEIWTEDIPNFAASAIGVVFHSSQTSGPVARLVVRHTTGLEEEFTLEAGTDLPWENAEFGVDYNLVFDNLSPDPIAAIGLIAEADVVVRGISLIQTANTTSRSVLLSTEGQYRFVHGGDVKIYENLAVMPRAFVVHTEEAVADSAAALERLSDPTFDGAVALVRIVGPDETAGSRQLGRVDGADLVTITHYTPERIELTADLASPGWLVVMDTYYPGWLALVDGVETDINEVNFMFRAIELPAGKHEITFAYQPPAFSHGLILTSLGLILLAALLLTGLVAARQARL